MKEMRSPFQYQRWESDDEHIIWLPPEFEEWEGKRSVYITGLRGTGKTTLLKGLEWSERLTNDSLKDQINGDPLEKRYIGVYLTMPDYISKDFINYPPRKDEINEIHWNEEKARIFCLYIEYQILQLFIWAIQGLRGKNILKYFPKQEVEIVKEILFDRPEIKKYFSDEKNEITLNDLRLYFKLMHENIRLYANEEIKLPKGTYPVLQMGKLVEEIVGFLINFLYISEKLHNNENTKFKHWTLKVCIDQFESLEHYQQKSINTMVARQGTGNVSFAIASLYGSIDIDSTFIPQHYLECADRVHYNLEKIYSNRTKFHELITSVTNLRFKKFTGINNVSIDLKYLLGEWDINAILFFVFRNSENKKTIELIDRARKNIGIKFFDFKRKNLPLYQFEDTNEEEKLDELIPEEKNNNHSNIPPLYQTYLVEKLNLKLPHEESEMYEIKAQKSAEIRKKMAAAMICLCKEYGIKKVPYAGYYMVISMSDQCIRDFLRQMHEIFIIENISAEKFIEKQINIKNQIQALHNASERRYSGIRNYTPYCVSEVFNLVDSLGKITSDIQSAYKDPSSLRNTEKGRFIIDFSYMDSEEDKKHLKAILNIARDSHYIKIYEDYSDDLRIKFRLHRLFAPRFGYSYRGAYSDVSIKKDRFGNTLYKLCTSKDKNERDKIINKLVSNAVKIHNIETLDKWIGD
jgi:hypothetical protein